MGPAGLVVDLGVVGRVQDSGRGRRDDDALHSGGEGVDGLEDARGALDSGIKAILDGVVKVQLVGGGGVDDVVEGRVGFDGLEDQ